MKVVQWNLVAALSALMLVMIALAPTSARAQEPAMLFGMNLSSIDAQTQAGVKPDMGMIWIGPWTLTSGWGGPDGEFRKASAAGVTPVVQYYYWGDDISRDCLENGCDSGLHGARKDKAGWDELARQLAVHLNAEMKGKKVLIILETEFNKGDVTTYEPLDGYLADKAAYFHKEYPGSEVVLGFGNWGRDQWGTWDRAAAACDATGVQGMRASTRNDAKSYEGLAQETLNGAKALRDRFQKPVYITDIGLSSHPEPEWLMLQKTALTPFFARLGEFKAAGVRGMLYRSFHDSPTMDTKNYFGEAERHWGLVWASNDTHKPAMKAWTDGVKKERGTPASSAPAPPPPPSSFEPTFQIKAPNEWWQEVFVQNTQHVTSGVQVRKDGGAWQAMTKSDWGAWTSSINTKAGSRVEFLAASSTGATAQSQPFTWMDGQLSKSTASSTAPPTATTTGPSTTSSTPTSSAASTPAPTTSVPTTSTASAPVIVLSREAETFALKSGGFLDSDAAASGGQRWTFSKNGYVVQGFDASAATYRVSVRVAGQMSNTAAPQMQVLIDGRVVYDAPVSTTSYSEHAVNVPLTAGRHEIKIAYTNDVSGLLSDRNLLLDRASVRTA